MFKRGQAAADSAEDAKEPQSVITIRMPRSMHKMLMAEAHDHHTSMNKLCVSKLVLPIAEENVLGHNDSVEQAWTAMEVAAIGEAGEIVAKELGAA